MHLLLTESREQEQGLVLKPEAKDELEDTSTCVPAAVSVRTFEVERRRQERRVRYGGSEEHNPDVTVDKRGKRVPLGEQSFERRGVTSYQLLIENFKTLHPSFAVLVCCLLLSAILFFVKLVRKRRT